jgi:hypothetical protein
MRIRIGWVSEVVRELFREANAAASMARPSTRLGVEKLEDRLVLSVTNGINLSVPGDAFALAGTADPTDFSAMYKWGQPGGLGTPVTITYSYSNLLDGKIGLAADTVKSAIQEALWRWASVAPLRFVEVPDSGPPISTTDYVKGTTPMIRFGHLSLDGPFGILGYGYYPGGAGLSGDIVFDDSEHWTTNPASGLDFLEVAEHELGHALGLAHEPAASAGGVQAIMNPYYGGVFQGLGTSHLFDDDINGVRALYGAGVGSVTPATSTITPASVTPGFALSGTTLYISGTAGADSVVFSGAGAGSVSLNGIAYSGSLSAVRSVVIDTGAGVDSVSVTGSTAAESFALNPYALSMTGAKWNVSAVNAEAITVVGGSEDRVSFEDAPGANNFIASPTQASLTGAGYSLVSKGIGSVTARMTNGGDDTASLYGSAGTNYFVSTPSLSTLYGSGYSITAMNFHLLYAYSSGQGDTATLNGSAGNYTAYANPAYTWLQADDGSSNVIAMRFANTIVNPGTGSNRALLSGSGGNDSSVTTPTQVRLSGQGYSIAVNNFQVVNVNGGGGADTAVLNDSAYNDLFQASPTTVYIWRTDDAYHYRLDGFANVTVNASNGGYDAAYLLDSAGVDSLVVTAGSTTLSGAGYSIKVNGFDSVGVTSVGGQDQVAIYDSTGNDTFAASGSVATMSYPANRVQLTGFARASLFNTSGVLDKKRLNASSMVLDFWGMWG